MNMKELSQHVLDLIQNSVSAGAKLIEVKIQRDGDMLIIEVNDDGCGMDPETIKKAVDPFFTKRNTRPVGLGLSLLAATAQRCDGSLEIHSDIGKGTRVRACFRYDHIDRPPLGDMAGTMLAMIVGNPSIDFLYRYDVDSSFIELDTRQIKKVLGEIPVNHPDVIKWLIQYMKERSAVK